MFAHVMLQKESGYKLMLSHEVWLVPVVVVLLVVLLPVVTVPVLMVVVETLVVVAELVVTVPLVRELVLLAVVVMSSAQIPQVVSQKCAAWQVGQKTNTHSSGVTRGHDSMQSSYLKHVVNVEDAEVEVSENEVSVCETPLAVVVVREVLEVVLPVVADVEVTEDVIVCVLVQELLDVEEPVEAVVVDVRLVELVLVCVVQKLQVLSHMPE
jgi:hypothetical protein